MNRNLWTVMKRKCKIVTDSNVDIKLILIRIFWRLIVVNLLMLKYKIVSDSNVDIKLTFVFFGG